MSPISFDITIHRLADDTTNEAFVPLAASFEEVAVRFDALPRMLLEPDGSFVWTGETAGEPWQLDGVLYDRNERVQYVEFKGSCPESQFDEILAALGWPAVRLAFRLTHEGVLMGEETFRQHAGWHKPTA